MVRKNSEKLKAENYDLINLREQYQIRANQLTKLIKSNHQLIMDLKKKETDEKPKGKKES